MSNRKAGQKGFLRSAGAIRRDIRLHPDQPSKTATRLWQRDDLARGWKMAGNSPEVIKLLNRHQENVYAFIAVVGEAVLNEMFKSGSNYLTKLFPLDGQLAPERRVELTALPTFRQRLMKMHDYMLSDGDEEINRIVRKLSATPTYGPLIQGINSYLGLKAIRQSCVSHLAKEDGTTVIARRFRNCQNFITAGMNTALETAVRMMERSTFEAVSKLGTTDPERIVRLVERSDVISELADGNAAQLSGTELMLAGGAKEAAAKDIWFVSDALCIDMSRSGEALASTTPLTTYIDPRNDVPIGDMAVLTTWWDDDNRLVDMAEQDTLGCPLIFSRWTTRMVHWATRSCMGPDLLDYGIKEMVESIAAGEAAAAEISKPHVDADRTPAGVCPFQHELKVDSTPTSTPTRSSFDRASLV